MTGPRAGRWDSIRGDILVAPSLLSADFACLGEEIARVEAAGARCLHLDVMDGRFVPNITFGPPLVAAVRGRTELWLDAHLMVADPAAWLEPFARSGADGVTIHAEAFPDIARCRVEADRLGIALGLAIRPDTPIEETLSRWGEAFDLVLVMTVMPGFGGQAYMDGADDRIAAAARYCRSAPRRPVLEVDGGIGRGIAGRAARAGARWFVAGSAIFRSGDAAGSFRALEGEVRGEVPLS